MLLRFGAKNYLSFKEGFEISFELNPNCPDSVHEGSDITNVICIVGPNASGKSNAIKALTFISDFCCNSFNKKPDEQIEITPFFLNKEATSFFVDFLIDNTYYFYEIHLTKEGVLSETLERKNNRRTAMFKREDNEIVYKIKELKELEKIKMRKGVSTISMAHQFEINALEKIYEFFSGIKSNIDPYFGDINFGDHIIELFDVTRKYKESQELFDFVVEKLASFDTGISNITIKEFKDPKGENYLIPFFIHPIDGKEMPISFYAESNGTKSLYSQLLYYKEALDTGGILLLDEFDNNLHPDLLEPLVNLFLDKKTNPQNAQLIFTTHNTNIMDRLTKYRVVLVNKKDNESFLYRLDEIPGNILRNDRSIESVYATGRIGGKPKI